ncbi:MAG: Trk system potassium transporter TrkA [Bacteroidales bacterium]|nr:Trk system potassium transporter TrkA [Bacteroidales bacterium]
MRIFIAGAGAVGTHLAKLFVDSDHEVTLMDEDDSKLQQVESHLDLMTRRGCMTSLADLKNADVERTDLFIAVPPSRDMSILACVLAKKLGAKTTIARANMSEYLKPNNLDFFRQLGVDEIIYPEQLAAFEAVESLKKVGIRQWYESSDGKIVLSVIKVREGAPLLNIPFAEIDAEKKKRFNIVAIYRQGDTIIPHGSDMLKHGDLAYFVSTHDTLPLILEDAGKEQYDIKNVMIVGGSRVGNLIARKLENMGGYNVKLIELNHDRSMQLANSLENTLIINGDGRNLELLKDEGISKMQAFVAVTDNAEINILACQLAKKMGIRKTVAEVENLDYIPLAEGIGIGTLLNKKLIAASHIYRYTLHAHAAYVKCLTSNNSEMLELVAQPGSKITKSQIKDLSLPKDMNIGAIVRDNEVLIASGQMQILPYDKVVMFAMQSCIHKIEKLFV